MDGIQPLIHSLLTPGVIVLCPDSPVWTPLFPVKKIRDKGQPVEWRLVQDLQAVNKVPNSVSNPNHSNIFLWLICLMHFSVYLLGFYLNLMANHTYSPGCIRIIVKVHPFMTLPLRPHLMTSFWHVFLFICTMLTIFCHILPHNNCAQRTQSYFWTICTQKFTWPSCQNSSLFSLQLLFWAMCCLDVYGLYLTKGLRLYNTFPSPLQRNKWCLSRGLCLIAAILIPNCATLETPLSSLIHGKGLAAHDKITWNSEAEQSFTALKSSLLQTPALALPDP